ncbi:hypothetical protein GNY06_08520 [Elizabethkingia argentiflava]|uniref:Uncharacterized protein n=1 Tax=Elizabethkingia argenteiflava TaxID=2681556 RepID=A0A845PWT9_9FLAO|nr:hypothetical protein [Elizabethkingia argenteiflava]NAW51421.1 hypothetical protein [Elizabethkingia argenteiflava]
MQLISRQHTKKFLAAFIVGIYTFTVFFAGFLHTHKDSSYSSATLKVEKSLLPNAKDCLSCHLLASPQLYEGFDFPLIIFKAPIFAEPIYTYQQTFFLELRSSFSLRGPPRLI